MSPGATLCLTDVFFSAARATIELCFQHTKRPFYLASQYNNSLTQTFDTYKTDVLPTFLHNRLKSEVEEDVTSSELPQVRGEWSEWFGNTDRHQQLQQPLVNNAGVQETIAKHVKPATRLSTKNKKHLWLPCGQSLLRTTASKRCCCGSFTLQLASCESPNKIGAMTMSG